MPWNPQRTLAEVDTLLCAPGNLHEVETCLVDGRLQRVYKHLWPSLRAFWLWASHQHSDVTYVVYETQRWTFREFFELSAKVASMYQAMYGIQKGDRVAICSRNYPEYLAAFWACHLIGAISVLVNAWLPLETLYHCLTQAQCKLIIVDAERAEIIAPRVERLVADSGVKGFILLRPFEGKQIWKSMQHWDQLLNQYNNCVPPIHEHDPKICPEDDATIFFTSGTTGLPKGVLSTQRQYLTNVLNTAVGKRRSELRRGNDISQALVGGSQKGMLLSVPLFHVTGLTSRSMSATLTGMKIVLMRKWNLEEAIELIKKENVSVAGGVPSMVVDLVNSSGISQQLDSITVGGAPFPDSLPARVNRVFPSATLSQGYGSTETNSLAVGFGGEDFIARPASCGLPMPVNDLLIIHDGVAVPAGTIGEVWIRGPNIMKGYWGDQAATDKVLTKDGWLKTGDLGVLDVDGFLYIRDRIKDIIIRAGENIDSVSVENALHVDDRIVEAAAVGIPDPKFGELVAAVVTVRPSCEGQVTEEALISLARRRLPKFAVPIMVLVRQKPFDHTASGKILKDELRKLALAEWKKRLQTPGAKL